MVTAHCSDMLPTVLLKKPDEVLAIHISISISFNMIKLYIKMYKYQIFVRIDVYIYRYFAMGKDHEAKDT